MEKRKFEFETKSGKTIVRVLLSEFWYGDQHCATINYKGIKLDVYLGQILED